jgi:glycosyltransferase involved in cell wall biosynthesis
MNPTVSVVLPVYNCENYIGKAVESILNQTFNDFELIVIDDKSTDKTVEVIRSFKDSRLQLFINEKNLGRAGSDNFALSKVKGKYIAKMDGDDICHPQRLKKQVLYLNDHPQVNVVGSWIQSFGASKYLHKYPEKSADIKCKILLGMPVGNSSIMLKSELFLDIGMRYDNSIKQAEDYDFFARHIESLNINVIPEPLLCYRTYQNAFKQKIVDERKKSVKLIRRKFLNEWGVPFSEAEFDLLDLVYNLDEPLEGYNLNDVEHLINKIINHNRNYKLFDDNALKRFLAQRWFYVCYHYPQQKLKSISIFYSSDLSKYGAVPLKLAMKFLIKGLSNFYQLESKNGRSL